MKGNHHNVLEIKYAMTALRKEHRMHTHELVFKPEDQVKNAGYVQLNLS